MPSDLEKSGRKSGGRRAARWALEFAATSVLIWAAFVLGGRALPQIAIGQLSDLTNTKIDVESVEFRFDGSVFIKNLVVRPRDSADYDNSILKADTVRVHFRLGSLLTLRPRVKEIFVDDFVLRALYNSDSNEWNLSALRVELPRGRGGRLPLVWFENGRVEYIRAAKERVRVVEDWPVSAGFRPADKTMCEGGYSFDISPTTNRQSFVKSMNVKWCPGKIEVGWRASSEHVRIFERKWTTVLDANLTYEPNGSYELAAKVKDFNSPASETRNLFAFDTNSVAEKAPFVHALQIFFNQYNPSGTIDINLQASGNLRRLNESKIEGKVICKDVALCDRNFPYTVEHLTGQVELTEKSAKLNSIAGRHGEVGLVFNGWAKDFGPDYKYNLQITSDNMLLDKDLYNAVNRDVQKLWSEFSPSGAAATNYSRVRLSPTDERSVLTVQLLNMAGMYTGFGYPLKNTTGKLVVADGNMVLSDMVSQWGGRKITVNGKVGLGRGANPSYDIVIKAEGIPLDATLEAALPAAQKEFYDQFETQGLIDATVKVVSAGRKGIAPIFTAEVFPKKSSLKAKALPILLNDVEGRVVFSPGMIDIEQLEGRYKGGTVAFSGLVWPAGNQREPGYCLSMRAKKVALSEDMADALPGSLGTMLEQLRPGGEVNLAADVSRNADSNCGPNRLIIECLGNTIDCNLLPYALHDISGKIAITQSHIAIEDITARASHTIRGLPIESVMRMAGSVVLSEANGTSEGTRVTAGDVNFSGENVRLKNKSLSKVNTVLRYDSESGQWLSKYFVANFYGGKMIGKLQFHKSDKKGLDYQLEASVAGADLKKFLSDTDKEVRPDEHYSTGSISGSVSVIGSFADDNIRLGRCRMKITDMQVGKMSPLANLLAVLNLTEPSDYAFDQMTVDAYIQDNKMFLRQLDLSGKSVAFYGSGWLDLKTDDIKMTLTTRGHRLAPASPSIWQSLTEGLGRAVVRVEVKGKISDPQITAMPLPVIKETLEILGTPKGE